MLKSYLDLQLETQFLNGLYVGPFEYLSSVSGPAPRTMAGLEFVRQNMNYGFWFFLAQIIADYM